ncbi:cytochrome C [Azospirillum sp. TSH58]|uniref:NapC/NirT family cytochrome c n=1 Tax=Azospirillum sp. TSH58 TaxID=664962 RepID=UPI000D602C92|nr:NapC/NirT family cytochrome c [Azospirillum sp. TSH58]AWJ83874.1 cytochrome C [Azospirillum sp. TSH58]PWC80931.1 cytochrome C [Azospirillum sp. TSH58]
MRWGWMRTGGFGALALAGLVGVVVGVVGWGGFNTAMEATNSMEFCISCHEMRDTVYVEYKTSPHYQNASGVRATCADCHVPRDWTHKVIRKVQASGELYHWLIGSIDSKEKFAAKRHTLARREWDRMRATDSQECRNCHSFGAMDFHKQTPKAASAMEGAEKAGKTCIDCHKGIAHRFPDVTAGHRQILAGLSDRAKSLALKPGDTAYALTSLALHTAPPVPGAAGDGEIAAATPVTILAAEGGALRVAITGWQRGSSTQTLYAQPGKRITTVKLNAAAVEHAAALRSVTDPETEQEWTEVRLTAWTGAGGYVATLGALWDYGARVYDANCSLCHTLHPPGDFDANAWIGKMNAMKRLTRLDEEEGRLLLTYLQSHAKDGAR